MKVQNIHQMRNRCTVYLQWSLTEAVEGRTGEGDKEPELTSMECTHSS